MAEIRPGYAKPSAFTGNLSTRTVVFTFSLVFGTSCPLSTGHSDKKRKEKFVMKQRKKRLTIFVMLAFVLIAAVVPSAFAATTSLQDMIQDMIISVGEEEYLYVFDSGSSNYAWRSENENICSVKDLGKLEYGDYTDSAARIKGVKAGHTRIWAEAGNSSFVWYIAVVPANDDKYSICFNEKDSSNGMGKVNLRTDEQYTLSWTSLPKDKLNYVSFESSDKKVATVDYNSNTGKAVVTAHATGRAIIIALVKTPDNNIDCDTCAIYVDTKSDALMSLDNTKITVGVGEGKQLNAKSPWKNDEFDWSSDNTSVARVSSSGYVTGKSSGTTTIKAVLKTDSRLYASCRVTVTGPSSKVEYNVEKNGKLNLDRSSFDKFSKDVDNSEVYSIEFEDLPTSSQGELYYRYGTGDEEDVTLRDTYYRSRTPLISDLTFIPAKGYTGTVDIAFSGRTYDGTDFTGSLKINVKGADNSLLSFNAAGGASTRIDASNLNKYCRDTTGADLDYVRFEEPDRGKLYYRYGLDDEELVTNGISYYYSGNHRIDDVVFRPENSDAGTVKIKFTGWDKNWQPFTAALEVTVEVSNSASDITGEILETEYFKFSSYDFGRACKSRKKGEVNIVKFILPDESVGSLLYDYEDSEDPISVSSSTAYSVGSGNLIDKVYFIPASGFTGMAEIKYTGIDDNTVLYDGVVRIKVLEDEDKPNDNKGDDVPDDNEDKNNEDLPPEDDTPKKVGTFDDVDTSKYFAVPVLWAVENGITTGTKPDTFSPDDKCTTAQILTFLWRAVGSPEPDGDNPFTDVPDDKYFAKPAIWASEQGMVKGTLFRPDEPCTRSETVKYLWILAGKPEAPASNFTDVPATADYCQAVAWAVQQGVTNGASPTTFDPSGTCTRAQIVTFLWRDLADQGQG